MSNQTVPVDSQSANLRINRANTLRQISRLCYAVGADGLPSPKSIEFAADATPPLLMIGFDTASEAGRWQQWLTEHSDDVPADIATRFIPLDGYWRGYQVQLFAPDFHPAAVR